MDLKKPPILPIPGKRNILITSALPYVNNVPHLGNIIGCVLSADVFARFCRLRGYNTIYVCGTDEYGTATETKAMEEKCSPKEICDKYHAIHKQVYDWFNISFDEFGRTSSPEQTEVCQAIFKKVMENNWFSENTMPQLYCDSCQRFLADRLVEGVCPTPGCNYGSARGDQCENCGNLLDATELKEPKCKMCQSTPHIRDTKHLFLELPLLKGKLEDYVKKTSTAGSWSQNAIRATNGWLNEGLRQRCITRDLKWGVPVPHEKFKDKVFYVWFDAPIGYVSITACYTQDWEKWWKNPENVELYQFMGKDNVPFHTVMFPSTLLGTGENWTLMKNISVTEYLNYEAGKFSKSKGIGVFGNDAKDTNIPVEVWRYYLLANRPEVSDTLFTWPDLQAKLNSELLSNLGNFINRVLSFIAKPSGQGYGSVIPDAPQPESHTLTNILADKVSKYANQYVEAMEKVKLKQGLKIAMKISGEGNAYLQESQFWKLYKTDQAACATVMRTSAGLVYVLACLLEPFMPSFSVEVLKQLNMPQLQVSLSHENDDIQKIKKPWEILPAGHTIGKPRPLFKELKDEEMKFYQDKFAGSQADRAVKAAADGNEKKKKAAKPANGSKPKSTPDAEITIARLDIHSLQMRENRAQITASTLCKFLSLNTTDFYEDVVKSDVNSLCTEILKRSPNGSSVLSNDEVMKWIAFADSFPLNSEECTASINGLNDELAQKSVLGNNFKISEVDVIVYSVIHSCLIAMSSSARKKFTNVLRWAYYVQDKVDLGEIFEKIPIEKLKFEPPTEDVGSEQKKPETDAASKDDHHDPISLVNIQVGLIRKAQKHPSADSLLVKEIDVGESKVRQVVSGLGKFYSPDDLLNRRVILITNLKPVMFKGTVSEGLILCAFNEDRSVVELLLPPESAKVGERVTFSGHVGKPEDVLDPKKKIFEKITPHVFTDDNGVATYKGIPFMTSAGPCTSSIRKGGIL